MLWTDKSLHVTFGIASVRGRGARVGRGSASDSGSFRWEGFASLADLRHQLVGAVLMGFGGVTALGCTIGQGLSGRLDAGDRLLHRAGRHRRRFGGDVEVHAVA